jgi:hypothetical protein
MHLQKAIWIIVQVSGDAFVATKTAEPNLQKEIGMTRKE